jgi:nucleolar protein 56
MDEDAWFAGATDPDALVRRVREGSTTDPADWPALAVESGFAADEDDYYRRLHETAVAAARAEISERERADDRQLVHAVRAMDDAERTANELAERVVEWAGTRFPDVGTGVAAARLVADREPTDPATARLVALAERTAGLADEADALREFVERQTPSVAPNLAEMAGPVLAARLVSLAGGLEALARKPSGTVQVLGAEDALFAHLAGHAPSPKHGVIYTHEYVRETRPEDRGSAARALAGKLAIAARIDHYGGDYRPEIHDQLRERMTTIRARAEGES